MDLGLRFGEKFRTRERKEKKKNTTVEREREMEEKIARRGGIPNDFQDFSTSIINRLLCSRSWKFRNGFETRRGCNFLRATCFHP